MLRFEDAGFTVGEEHAQALVDWQQKPVTGKEIQFRPARVLLQDFTGVPCVVDLAAMRDAIKKLGGDTAKINPQVPVNLVIDHSVMVDEFGHPKAMQANMDLEYARNAERYDFLKWGSKSFNSFSAVPPGTGICHQVNLEYIARGVWSSEGPDGQLVAYPDTCVGTDSHTTMINGLGVLGWGVGGIEAEAAMLGQPISMLIPEVVGFRLEGRMAEGVTATDLVLTCVAMLRDGRRRGPLCGVLRSGRCQPFPRGPRHHRQHGPRIRRDLRLFRDRRQDARLPAPHRPGRGGDRAGRGIQSRAGPVVRPRARRRYSPRRSTSTWHRSCRRWPDPSGRRTVCPCRWSTNCSMAS